jgi:hypothetical protein
MRIMELSFTELEHDAENVSLTIPEDDFFSLFLPVIRGRNKELRRRTIEWLSNAFKIPEKQVIDLLKQKRLP